MLHTFSPTHQPCITKSAPGLYFMVVADPALHGWSKILAFIVGKTEMLGQVVFTVKGTLLGRLFGAESVVVAF